MLAGVGWDHYVVLDGEAKQAVEFSGVDPLSIEITALAGGSQLPSRCGDALLQFPAERIHDPPIGCVAGVTLYTSCRSLQFMMTCIAHDMK